MTLENINNIVTKLALEEVVANILSKNKTYVEEGGFREGPESNKLISVDISSYFQVIDAFSMPRFRYRPEDKTFVKYGIFRIFNLFIYLFIYDYIYILFDIDIFYYYCYCHFLFLFFSVEANPQIFASASTKSAIYKDRYELIKQRLLRNENFRPPPFDSLNQDYIKV